MQLNTLHAFVAHSKSASSVDLLQLYLNKLSDYCRNRVNCRPSIARTNYRADTLVIGNAICNPIGCWYGCKTTTDSYCNL